MRLSASSCLAIGLLAGCSGSTTTPTIPKVTNTISLSSDIDILLVIDNSSSTEDKQALFAANFPRFVQALDAFPGGRPSLHIGVVSTSVGTGSDANFGVACAKTLPNDDGLLQNVPRVSGCSAPNGQFISDLRDGPTRTVNYTGTLDQALPCISSLGGTGCGFEAPLEAMKRALDGSRPENAGFLRPYAYLAVVILTDEDDCSVRDPTIFSIPNLPANDFRCQPLFAYRCDKAISATAPDTYNDCTPVVGGYLQDTSAYRTFLSTIKDPSQTLISVIAGTDDSTGKPPDPTGATISTGMLSTPTQMLALLPSCKNTSVTPNSIARPGLRLADFVSQFGDHGQFYSVCASDYSQAFAGIGTQLSNAMSPCLDGPIDRTHFDPAATGQKLDCTVYDVAYFDVGNPIQVLVPPCEMQADPSSLGMDVCATGPCPAPGQPLPCWYIQEDTASCSQTETQLEIHVPRAMPPPPTTSELVSCTAASM